LRAAEIDHWHLCESLRVVAQKQANPTILSNVPNSREVLFIIYGCALRMALRQTAAKKLGTGQRVGFDVAV
jgi:hypothetical protein